MNFDFVSCSSYGTWFAHLENILFSVSASFSYVITHIIPGFHGNQVFYGMALYPKLISG